jgi:hypothetical protein
MRHFGRALRLMIALGLERYNSVVARAVRLGRGRAQYEADVYEPAAGAPLYGCLVFIHGMSIYGHRDPRVVELGRALATAGFRSVMPLIPDIQDLRIAARQRDEIGEAIGFVCDDPGLCAGKRPGVMAPSFSAGLTLVACSRPALADRVAAVCTIGSYAHADTVVELALYSQEADEYARLILLWNFFDLILEKNTRVKQALKIAAVDNGARRSGAQALLPAALAKLSAKDRALFDRMRQDPQFRRELGGRISRTRQIMKLAHEISPLDHAAGLRVPVILVHGRGDDVIAPTESEQLYAGYRAAGADARLCLTPFISHGDAKLSFKQIPEAMQLASAFAYFFRCVAGE